LFVRALEWEFKSSQKGLTSNSENKKNESSSSQYGWISANDLYVIADEMCQNCANFTFGLIFWNQIFYILSDWRLPRPQ